MGSSKKSTPAPKPAAAEPAAEPVAEAAAVDQPLEAAAEPEVAEAVVEEADDGALAEINATLRPMRAVHGEGSCDRYDTDKDGNVLVPASEVPHMLEHGFVLVDDEA